MSAAKTQPQSGACTMAEDEYRDYVKRTVDAAPPLKPAQIARLTGPLDYEKPPDKKRQRR